MAGHVVASSDPGFREGDAVLVTGSGLSETRDGGYSEYVRLPAEWVIPLPDGLSLDAEGNLYAVNSGPGNSSQKLRKVFRILRNGIGPGGYGAAEVIDDAVPSADLQDTRYVRTSTPGGLKRR